MIIDCDFSSDAHCQGLLDVLDEYARLPQIGSTGLSDYLRANLCSRLAAHPTTHALLAVDDANSDDVVGIAICFLGFSTFAGQPLLNIHDIAVRADQRGRGIGQALLDAVDAKARSLGCCRVTLEVVPTNEAKRLYERSGFVFEQEFGKKNLAAF